MDAAQLARIRFVTSRYRELQGLRELAVVPACLSLLWTQPYVRLLRYVGPWEAVAGLVLSIAPWVCIAAAHPLFDRYDGRRFGHVATSLLSQRDSVVRAIVLIAGLAIDAWVLANGRATATLTAFAVTSLHVVVRDWPWRTYHAVIATVSVAAICLPDAAASGVNDTASLLRRPLTIALCAYAVACYLDHRLLTGALSRGARGHAGSESVPEHADPV